MNSLWDGIMQKCLDRAENLLDKKTAPTAATVEAVKGLVETAIALREVGGGVPIRSSAEYVPVFRDGKLHIEKRE